jgi:hypothetical protein
VDLSGRRRSGHPLRWTWFAATGAGFFLLVYSQPTGLPMAFLGGLFALVMLFLRFRAHPACKVDLIKAAALFAVLALPFVFVPWGLGRMFEITSGAEREQSMKALQVTEYTLGAMLWRAPAAFGWGITPVRYGFTLLALAGAVAASAVGFRRRRFHLLFPLFLVVGFLLFLVSRNMAAATYESRYVSTMLPVYVAFCALGLWKLPSLAVVRRVLRARVRRPAAWALAAVAVLLLVRPALLCARLDGSPAPYKRIVEFCDSQLPPGCPVLVDRWFEPWNELKVYPSTNAFFTFTVPNEPVATFIQVKWRDTAKAFFERYPNAAYLEIAKSYWTVPEVGSWDWPREHFAHHVIISNSAGLALRELGLANRGDFYAANTNRLVVELFYDTPEDVVKKARDAGRSLLALYGPGWGYTKTQDYRDWRVLSGSAAVLLYNLTGAPLSAELSLRGVSLGGSKMIRASNGAQHVFPQEQPQDWKIGNALLPPGETILQLGDMLWPSAQNMLLVEDIAIRPAEPAPAAGPAPAPVPAEAAE